jgi:DNA invertase Pin-like site-specific DNA recombinase
MSDMVERVAIALCDKALWDGAWLQANETERNEQRYRARAAIQAMREPTKAMINSPMARCYNDGPYADKEVRRIYSAMIDEALK